jgi:hypothetical protein
LNTSFAQSSPKKEQKRNKQENSGTKTSLAIIRFKSGIKFNFEHTLQQSPPRAHENIMSVEAAKINVEEHAVQLRATLRAKAEESAIGSLRTLHQD